MEAKIKGRNRGGRVELEIEHLQEKAGLTLCNFACLISAFCRSGHNLILLLPSIIPILYPSNDVTARAS